MLPIKKISIVIPVYNEERSLSLLIQRTASICEKLDKDYEIIFIDDGSNDDSVHILTNAIQIKNNHIAAVIFLNRNYGQHSAIMAGFRYVTGDLIITLDADLQNPPEEITKLVKKADEGYDVVGSVRENRQDSFFRKIASRILNRMISRITGKIINDYGCMLRAYRRHIIDVILRYHQRNIFIPILANSFAYKVAEISVKHVKRRYGKSKYNLIRLVYLMYDIIMCLTTTTSLPILNIFGSIIFFIGISSFILSGILPVIFCLHWKIENISIMFSILFILVSIYFISIGILIEYISRIYDSVCSRPRYYIQRIIRQEQTISNKEMHS